MQLRNKLTLFFLVQVLLRLNEVTSNSSGSPVCTAGGQATVPGHNTNNGALSGAGLVVKVNGVVVQPDSTTNIPAGQATTIAVEGSVKGVLLRIDTGGAISPVDANVLQSVATCVSPAAAVTHKDSSSKSSVSATLTPNVQSGTIKLDITVVNAITGFYYNGFNLAVAAAAPVPVPVPVPAPVPVPVPAPVPAAVPVPVPAPVPTVPVPAPVPVPTVPVPAPVPVIPIVPEPTKSPSVRAVEHSSVRNPAETKSDARSAGYAATSYAATSTTTTTSSTSTATSTLSEDLDLTGKSAGSEPEPDTTSSGSDSDGTPRKNNNLGKYLRNFGDF